VFIPGSYFWKLALFIDERYDIHGLHSNHVQYVLIIDELYVIPLYVLIVVLFLFQFEYVLHEKLLQVFVCKIDAQLFETLENIRKKCDYLTIILIFELNFSNKKYLTKFYSTKYLIQTKTKEFLKLTPLCQIILNFMNFE
jgi:hypothetical protein